MNASDPDSGAITNSRITSHAGPDFGDPAISGLVLYTSIGQLPMASGATSALTQNGTYAAKVCATDSSGAIADWDILMIALTSNNVAPITATPSGGSSQSVPAGSTLTLVISASDSNSAQNVTLQAQGLPPNATFTPGAPGNPTSGTLVFTSQPGQSAQMFNFNIVATDNDGAFPLSTTLNMQLSVSAASPQTVPTANAFSLLVLALGLAGVGLRVTRRKSA